MSLAGDQTFFFLTQDSLKHLACEGLPWATIVLQIGQASRWMFSNCPSLTWGRPAPPVAGTRDGWMRPGGQALRCAACRAVLVGVSQRLPEQIGVVLWPSPGRPTALPLGLDPPQHQGTGGEGDGDLKGPPTGVVAIPALMPVSRWAVSLGGPSAASGAPTGQEGTWKGCPIPWWGRGWSCPQREGRAGAVSLPEEISTCPGP